MAFDRPSGQVDIDNVSRLRTIASIEAAPNGHQYVGQLVARLSNDEAKSVAMIILNEEPIIEDTSLREMAQRIKESVH